MASHIDFQAKTDREILVLICQTVNTINEHRLPEIDMHISDIRLNVREHEKRLVSIETSRAMNKAVGKTIQNNRLQASKRWAGGGGITITAVGGIVYGIGKGLSWW